MAFIYIFFFHIQTFHCSLANILSQMKSHYTYVVGQLACMQLYIVFLCIVKYNRLHVEKCFKLLLLLLLVVSVVGLQYSTYLLEEL